MQKSHVKRAKWAMQGDAISYMGPHGKKKSKQMCQASVTKVRGRWTQAAY